MSSAWRQPRMLLDGAMGTELMARGLDPMVECAEAWNRARPEVVQSVYRSYFDVGADAIQTNTFGGTRFRLGHFERKNEVRQLNVVGALLAREVRPAGRLVIGSMGPTGLLPPPEGNADLAEMEDAFAEQAMALGEGGVDLLHIETFYHPKEARAALRGARAGAPGLAIVASMTCRLGPGGYTTPIGFTPEAMLAAFLEEGADGVGANCSLPPAQMIELVRLLRSRTERPIFAKPTAFPSSMGRVPVAELATGALALLAAGATAIGGCCGTTPADIGVLRQTLSAPLQDLGM